MVSNLLLVINKIHFQSTPKKITPSLSLPMPMLSFFVPGNVVSERTSQRALRTEYVNENTVQPPWELAAVVVDTSVSDEQPTNYSYCALPLFIAALVVV